MSAVVKMRHTERPAETSHAGVILRFRPRTPAKIIRNIEREYAGYLIDGDGDELLDISTTDWYRKMRGKMTPGQYLKYLREGRNMTQKDIAGLTGHRPSYISDLETGQRDIGRKTAKSLADIFKASPALFI